jgi:DNA-binding GntR family transcriptional regulator
MTPERIAALIGQAIREKVFAPGTPLIQEDLAKRFNVSRNPVREALKILAAEGVVSMPPGGAGATVRRLSNQDLEELYHLRLVLEPEIAPHIINGAVKKHVEALRSLAHRMDDANETSSWMRLNYEFHIMLYELADRPHTESILRGLLSAVQPYSQENIETLGGRPQASHEHHLMVQAIVDGDPDRLSELFVVHLKTARERLVASFAADPSPDPMSSLRGFI